MRQGLLGTALVSVLNEVRNNDCVKGSSSLKFMVIEMDCSDEFDAFVLPCLHTEFG